MKLLVWGFILSVILTVGAYVGVTFHVLSGASLLFLVLGLGSLQALIQMICFFHLGIEKKPQWQLLTFLFMIVILLVVVGGSLWIMYNLNYNMQMS